ncbi:MAG: NAD(P)H-dependent oxidoreductase [Burkholderiales bacterium]|jgi:NAD(P)H-dependent FMN reductase|nr:NAD(P)H-dependent oxidoreductase [Burkholderiales bacterium]
MTPRILAFAGSLRAASWNRKLVTLAAAAARDAGADVTLIDLKQYPLPVFDEDLEQAEGLPPAARALKALFKDHHGLLVSCPEYNSSITGVLKNTIDWVSRADGDESGLAPYADKVVGLLSASPGSFAALRSMEATRGILMQLGCLVLPKRHALARAHEAFAADGSLKDATQAAAVRGVAQAVVDTVRRLRG